VYERAINPLALLKKTTSLGLTAAIMRICVHRSLDLFRLICIHPIVTV
jgi:hypothetical protein